MPSPLHYLRLLFLPLSFVKESLRFLRKDKPKGGHSIANGRMFSCTQPAKQCISLLGEKTLSIVYIYIYMYILI